MLLWHLHHCVFQRNAQDYEETRQGMTVFAGDAASCHEWQLRLQIKKSLCKAEELPALTAKVVDALRGEALSCAMEIGLAKLMEANGLDLLVQKVQDRLFPQRTASASWRTDEPSPGRTDDELHLASSSLVDSRVRDGQHARAR